MRKYFFLLITSATLLLNSCSSSHSQVPGTSLPPAEFSEKMKALPSATLIDVRTPDEFSKGHLQNAKNIDWNGPDFQAEISKFDKSNPLFVYCHSGRRSAAAAEQMRLKGFTEVYELQGGIVEWREAQLPEMKE